MKNKLKLKYMALINRYKELEHNEARQAIIEALEEVAVFAETLRVEEDDYEDFETIASCLEDLKNLENQEKLQYFVQQNISSSTDDTQSSNRKKAIGILALAVLEFLVLALVIGTLTTLAGAVILGIGFAAATWLLAAAPEPVLLQTVALAGIIIGAIIGGLIGLYKAGDITYSDLQQLKTWADFERYDSMWDLVIHGKSKKMLVAERLQFAFFKNEVEAEEVIDSRSNSLNDI